MKKLIVGIILLVVFVIVTFSIIGGTASDLQTGADSVTDANNCSLGTDNTGSSLVYNITNKFCENSTGGALYLAEQFDLPLNSLFGRNSVIMLVLMTALFVGAVVIIFKSLKSQ